MDELKRRAYCKWYNSFSRATNDCNVFRRWIHINEGRMIFQDVQINKQSFPVNTLEMNGKKILVR
jgi:hypothetical protein